jgi:hypothetical protein
MGTSGKAAMIVDSDVLINASREQSDAIDFLIRSGESEILRVSVISYLELQAGARNKQELRRIEKFLNRFELITIDEAISLRSISLMQQYRLSHGVTLPDALIAATALERTELLATGNSRDFAFIEGLTLAAL